MVTPGMLFVQAGASTAELWCEAKPCHARSS